MVAKSLTSGFGRTVGLLENLQPLDPRGRLKSPSGGEPAQKSAWGLSGSQPPAPKSPPEGVFNVF